MFSRQEAVTLFAAFQEGGGINTDGSTVEAAGNGVGFTGDPGGFVGGEVDDGGG